MNGPDTLAHHDANYEERRIWETKLETKPSYRESLTSAMTELGRDPLVCFIGYGVKYGKAMGTLKDVSESQLVETTVAENLMVGLATGLALTGRRPVVFFERFDFVLNAADAIVNHLDKLATLSRGEFRAGVIIRVVVGNKTKPLFTGETHTQDFTMAFRSMLQMQVLALGDSDGVATAYRWATHRQQEGESTMLVEYKDLL